MFIGCRRLLRVLQKADMKVCDSGSNCRKSDPNHFILNGSLVPKT